MELGVWQIVGGLTAAILIGISKTGVPGTGILWVPILAAAFGGRESVGIALPMLIVGDIFAVIWFQRHAKWDKVISLIPSMLVGMVIGSVCLWKFGKIETSKDIMGIVIGILVLFLLLQYMLQNRISEHLKPTSKIGTAATGGTAGFATVVANAAVISIYLTAHRLNKEELIGTSSWFFLAINTSKVPLFIIMTIMNPSKPIMTSHTLMLDLLALPAIVAGVFIGKWILASFPQKVFEAVVLGLAGIAAVKLIVG